MDLESWAAFVPSPTLSTSAHLAKTAQQRVSAHQAQTNSFRLAPLNPDHERTVARTPRTRVAIPSLRLPSNPCDTCIRSPRRRTPCPPSSRRRALLRTNPSRRCVCCSPLSKVRLVADDPQVHKVVPLPSMKPLYEIPSRIKQGGGQASPSKIPAASYLVAVRHRRRFFFDPILCSMFPVAFPTGVR